MGGRGVKQWDSGPLLFYGMMMAYDIVITVVVLGCLLLHGYLGRRPYRVMLLRMSTYLGARLLGIYRCMLPGDSLESAYSAGLAVVS